MTSLAEVYEDAGGTRLRRLYLSTAVFVIGACMVVIGMVIASTDLLAPLGVGTYGARKVAGVAAGLGVPAVFVGIFSVLPASRRERAAAAIGASVAVLGVALFWQVYPSQWYGATPDHVTLPVVAVYFLGAITTFWALFTAVVNFKTRNDPGGTVTLTRTVEGETQTVEVPVAEFRAGGLGDVTALGSVGVLGDLDPDAGEADDAARVPDAPTSDGGTTGERLRTPGADRAAAHAANPDRYCGNCAFFDYANARDGMHPYCGYREELMDDVDPCEAWEPNLGG